MKKIKTMIVFGTRPDAIKMMPLVYACQKDKRIDPLVCATAQHREMLDSVLERFQVKPDYDLNVMQPSQTLTQLTTRILERFGSVLEEAKPDAVLVHGDTTTGFAAGLAAFYHKIPVGHVEAGLRTGNPYSPFPEEMNRTLIGRLASMHFAPTEQNRENLIREHTGGSVYITGNTAIDVLRYTVKPDYSFSQEALNTIDYQKRIILLTAHRRENLDGGLSQIFAAVKRIIRACPDVEFIFPVHRNPAVQKQAAEAFEGLGQVHRIDPIDVFDMHNLISRCYMVMTDSGGLQEEGPSLKKPVIVLRRETERMEAVNAGTAILAGVEEQPVFDCAMNLLTNKAAYEKMSCAANPFGDGYASEKIVDALCAYFA